MIAAYSDDDLDEDELNLIKDYTYENTLTEQEWREISFFSKKKASEEEIRDIVNEIMSEINSKKERVDILNALREIIEADEITSTEEKNIMRIIEEEMGKNRTGIFLNLAKSVSSGIRKRRKELRPEDESEEFVKNPILSVLNEKHGSGGNDVEVISAVLGLAVALINADMEYHEKERSAFIELIQKETGLGKKEAGDLAGEIGTIPDTYFELAYLGRIIADSAGRERRMEILSSLFDIAYADSTYSPEEDNYLRVISKYLLLEHRDFIALKMERKE
jgi:uncharacterized tellurite resistance protein B-like protein